MFLLHFILHLCSIYSAIFSLLFLFLIRIISSLLFSLSDDIFLHHPAPDPPPCLFCRHCYYIVDWRSKISRAKSPQYFFNQPKKKKTAYPLSTASTQFIFSSNTTVYFVFSIIASNFWQCFCSCSIFLTRSAHSFFTAS